MVLCPQLMTGSRFILHDCIQCNITRASECNIPTEEQTCRSYQGVSHIAIRVAHLNYFIKPFCRRGYAGPGMQSRGTEERYVRDEVAK